MVTQNYSTVKTTALNKHNSKQQRNNEDMLSYHINVNTIQWYVFKPFLAENVLPV